jgi:itaconate CoA-transferase
MLECMTEWMGNPLYYAYDGAEPPPRAGASHATIYPYGPFRAGDGKTVMLGLQNEREWAVFCETVLVRPELTEDVRFFTNTRRSNARAELDAIIAEVFAPLTSEQVIARLETAHIANARMNDMHDLWAHPQLKARGRWVEVASPAGPIRALLPPGMTDARMDGVPALGEHTESILIELGYHTGDIARLRADHVI